MYPSPVEPLAELLRNEDSTSQFKRLDRVRLSEQGFMLTELTDGTQSNGEGILWLGRDVPNSTHMTCFKIEKGV
jgi:hypothetical protein